MHNKGMPQQDIADIVSRNRKTVGMWLKAWQEERMASIFTGHQGNQNAGKLTKAQKKEIRETLQKSPSAYDIPGAFWDVPSLRQYVKTKFDIVYESDRSYHFLLEFSNLSFKYPDTFDKRRNEKHIKNRMAEIKQEITPLLKDPAWEVYTADEVRIELEAEIRRAWLKRGERTVVKVDRNKEAQSYIGFLNQQTFCCFLYRLAWQNQEEVIRALTAFVNKRPGKRICIIWDNALFHKGKKIQSVLRKGGPLERVHLVQLPPYSPDENPIEKVWNAGKKSAANIQADTFTETRERFEKFVRGKTFKYAM